MRLTSIRNDRSALITVIFGMILLTILWSALFLKVQAERQQEINNAIKDTGNYARTFAEHTVRTLHGLEDIVMSLKLQAEHEGLQIDLPRLVNEGRFKGQPFVQLGIADAFGNITASHVLMTAPVSIADLEHFKAHLSSDSGRLYIGKPTLGRISGKWTIQTSRRINNPDGSLRGVAVVGVDPNYFAEFYKQVDLGPQSIIGLLGRDGIMRIRQSDTEVSLGQDFSNQGIMNLLDKNDAGSFNTISPLDGQMRIRSYRVLREYPLAVIVGITEEYVLKDFHQRVVTYYWFCGSVSLLIIAFSGMLLVHMRQRNKAEEGLRRSAETQSVLREIAEAAVVSPSLDELYAMVHKLVGKVLPAKQFHINLLDEAANEIVVPFNTDDISYIPARRPVDKGMTEYIMHLGHAVLITPEEMIKLSEAGEYTLAKVQNVQVRHYLGAPLIDSHGRPFGVIALIKMGRTNDFQPGDIEVFSIIAAQVSMAIERKQAETKLGESEDKYRQLFEMESDAIFLIDAQNGAIMDVNAAGVGLYGYSREELLRMRNVDLSAEPQETKKAGDTAAASGVVVIPIRYHRKKDGTIFPVEINATSLLWKGKPVFIPAIRDISKRMQDEEVLRRSVEIQTVLREIAEAAVLVHSLDALYAEVSRLINKVMPAENFHLALLDEKNHQINVVFSADKDNLIPRQRSIGKGLTEYALQQGRPVHLTKMDIERLREIGEVTLPVAFPIYEWLGAPLLDSSERGRGVLVVVSTDPMKTFRQGDLEVVSIIAAQVSMAIERKQAEEAVRASQVRYKALVEQSSEAQALMDLQTQEVVEINRRVTELFGYSLPEDSPLYAKQVATEPPESTDWRYNTVLKEQHFLPPAVMSFRHKNGTAVLVERAGTVVTLDGRDYLLVSMRDLTTERRREAEMARDVEVASRVQRELLPLLPASPLVTLRSIYRPSHLVSGDSYQLEWRNEGLLRGFLLDVSGHGLATALQTASISVLLREATVANTPLLKQVQSVNAKASKYFIEGSYATILGFEVDLLRRELRYVGAGISRFYINGREILAPGMFAGMWEDAEFTAGVIPVAEGDCIHFLTDGFTDALMQPENAGFWSPDGKDFDADVTALEKLVESGKLRDDATGICLKINGLL